MKSILKQIVFCSLVLPGGLSHAQSVDSAAIYARGASAQSRMMIQALSLPALPNINYTLPAALQIGQTVSYLPTNSGGNVYSDGDVTLLAGSTTGGYINGIGTDARLQGLAGMVAGSSGLIYVSDAGNHTIRSYDPQTREVKGFVGPTSSVSGWVDGTGSIARFYKPVSICKDGSGNLYISDRGNNMVRKISPTGAVTTLAGSTTAGYADGTGSSARFSEPWGITVDGSGNVYVTDENNRRIRRITPSGVVSTFAGSGSASSVNGTGTAASFYGMKGIAADASGNLYVSEYNGCKIRKITSGGVVTTFAGSGSAGNADGTGTGANLYFPMAITVDGSGNVYVTQLDNRIRKITPSGVVTTIAGNGSSGSDNGSPLSATFSSLNGIYAFSPDNLYIGDSGNNQVRWKGEGNGYSISPALPSGMVFDKTTGKISGIPTAVKPLTSYTVTAYNAAGSATKVISFAVVAAGLSPSNDQNYIITRTARKAGFLTSASLDGSAVDDVNIDVQYFDGLGRKVQDIQWQGSPSKNDLVQHIEYDGFGRESIKYLPHVKNLVVDGSFKPAAKADQLAYYAAANTWDPDVVKTGFPYSVTFFDSSPLNRVQQQGAPGTAWQPSGNRNTVAAGSNAGRTVGTDYGTNGTSDVRMWTVNSTGTGATATFYTAGKLFRTVIRDENWINTNAVGSAPSKTGSLEEFKDYDGRLVLKRIWETETKALNTYYVYDDFGDLRYVIPPAFPAATITLTEAASGDFHELVYAYKYDARRRLIEKKVPGKGWEYLVYNKNDQVVLTQDAVQRAAKKWSYTKYDPFGRTASTGVYTNTIQTSRSDVQALADAVSAQWDSRVGTTSYTDVSFPAAGTTKAELTVNYYDDYKFKATNILVATGGIDSTWMVRGLLTGTKVSRDDGTSPLLSVIYYNKYGKVIETISDNHLLGVDRITNTYNFSGQPETSKHQHRIDGSVSVTTLLTTNKYDHMGRLIETWKKVNSQTDVLQSRLVYNEVGQLKTKSLHSENSGTNFMTSIAYTYNERGWQSKISSPQYTSQLNYNMNGTAVLANAQYNGNIAQQLWGHSTTTSSTFIYGYDALNRLKSGMSSGTEMSEVLAYDDNGNISTLKRDNGTTITYGYNNTNKSNRLATLSGGLTGSFTYDQNGNATVDRTGMVLTYNHLNLPKTIIGSNKNIAYSYDAMGSKLTRVSDVNSIITQRDYIGGIEYNRTGGGTPVIDRIATEDGFLLNSSGSYSYYYNLTDHLGNVRSVLKKEGTATAPTATVMQQQDYYPFGKTKSIATSIDNKYLYNGKEMQPDLNGGTHTFGSNYVLEGQLDYGARFYDAEIGRWNVLDPMAEKAFSLTPYRYGFNNPVRFLDPNGSYETDGHFWTVYLMATLMGRKDAFRIAYNTESPDNIMNRSGDIISSPSTWLNINDQRNIHALNGGSSAKARAYGASWVGAAKSYGELGKALHYLGDSYAHSVMGNEGSMYPNGRGHLFDWHDPDKISLRPGLYSTYVSSLSSALGARFGFKGQVDMFTFDYIAKSGGSTEQNSAVFETEIRLREGAAAFSMDGNQVGAINKYMKARNSHYGTTTNYKAVSTTVTSYKRNGNGEWYSENEEKTFVNFE